MKQRLVERMDLNDFREAVKGRIDREQGIIRDVKLMGLQSKNGRRYNVPDPNLFEGVAIRVDHHGREGAEPPPMDPSFERIWAVAKNVRSSAEGVKADLHYNKAHPLVPSILWWAENQSGVGGFSPVTWGVQQTINGETVISIVSVESVDLVDRPATTRGFFEQENTMDPKEIAKLQENLTSADARVRTLEAEKTALEKRATEAEAKLAAREAADKAAERKARRKGFIAEAKLPAEVVTEKFESAVINAATDDDAQALVETVRLAAGAPRSGAQTPGNSGGSSGVKYESYEAAKAAGAFKDPV